MQYNFLIMLSVLFFCIPALAQTNLSDFFGKWDAVAPKGNIFEGEVNILAIETRPFSVTKQILAIYDETQRGLLCSMILLDENKVMCTAVMFNKLDVTSLDRSHLVTEQMEGVPPVVIKLIKQDDSLILKGCSIGKKGCIENEDSSLNLLSVLEKK